MKLVSVIVPIYNVEDYISDCIESIINQTYTDLEILLIDDGSTDNSSRICDEYAQNDSRIKVFHKKNNGVSAARNFGLDIAIGEYIIFVDSDDCININFIKILASSFDDNIDIVIADYYDSYNEKINFYENVCKKDNQIIKINSNFDCTEKYAKMNVWGNMYKRTLIENLRFDENLSIGEDTLFHYMVLNKSKYINYIHTQLYYYRHRETSVMNEKFSIKKYDEIRSLKKFVSLFKNGTKANKTSAARLVLACYIMYNKNYKYKNNCDIFKLLTEDIRNYIYGIKYVRGIKIRIAIVVLAYFPKLYHFLWKRKR